jgi:hypothetical protein
VGGIDHRQAEQLVIDRRAGLDAPSKAGGQSSSINAIARLA